MVDIGCPFLMIRLHNGFVIDNEALYLLAESSVGMVMPRPPSLGGREKRSRSFLLVRVGMLGSELCVL